MKDTKQITITETEKGFRFDVKGFTPMEVLGILRFHEKQMWVKLVTPNHKPEKIKKPTKP